MKKIVILMAVLGSTRALFACQEERLTTAVTAGYVFKTGDCTFKEVYGHGMANVITIDGCYYFCKHGGLGSKIGYWRAQGCTSFLHQKTLLQEVPLTFYLRGKHDFCCGLQLYASLGGGAIFVREKSYLGHAHVTKGIGEVEAGFNYPLWNYINFTGALRYLFPRERVGRKKVDIGGCDLRGGIAFMF